MLLMARSKRFKRLEPWHHRLIDWLLANPEKPGRAAAEHFGVSPVWISIVKNSPVFRTEFDWRREIISRSVTADIAEQATALADLTLDVMIAQRNSRVGGWHAKVAPAPPSAPVLHFAPQTLQDQL